MPPMPWNFIFSRTMYFKLFSWFFRFNMVYHCAVADCKSHDSKRLRPDVHPWMQGVTWVKFPKDPTTLARWKRLIRRGGKSTKENVVDEFKLHRNSRICSRHFDPMDINADGIAKRDPKHFSWNNWGKPSKPRSTSSVNKLDSARKSTADVTPIPLPVYSIVTDVIVPEVGQVQEVTHNKVGKDLVGGKISSMH